MLVIVQLNGQDIGLNCRSVDHASFFFRNNTVVLQFEVDDVRELFAHLEQTGASINNEPTFNKQDGFWFGAFADPEGNPYWVVDKNCP